MLTLAAIGVWAWGSGQAKSIGGPAQLLEDSEGHLYVQMQTFLLEFDIEGEFVARHDLTELGVERVLGGMGFFANGELLLRIGPDTRSLFDSIRAFLRLPNPSSTQPGNEGTGLHRCRLDDAVCAPFGDEAIDFAATFGVFIDPATGVVYISDTSRHTLRKFSHAGAHIAEASSGLRFPNGLLMHEGRLYVADTNHHRVRIVDAGPGGFR